MLYEVITTLLFRYTRQEDIMIGTVVANRSQHEVLNIMGFVVNTLVSRTALQGDVSFNNLLKQVKKNTVEMYEHQELPFDILLEELRNNFV